jgi:tetratricopeptide (TPR) repeat protein/predicted Ser/Thr protein kinase
MNRDAEILFHELADLSPVQRQRYFDTASVPVAVREEVERLLRFDTPVGETITESVAQCAERLLDRRQDLHARGRCGPYRLTRLLGRGGMGSVYLAERDDGEVDQLVAIKFLRFGDEPGLKDRFLRERQILAKLNHPGIARLLDAGHSSLGQPYLVMEYIEGEPVDVYASRLDLREKVGLFVEVCDAVSYAHRNLIVHRDLKPSNILVDRAGRPKLLDFGIARILDEAGGETQTRDRLLTPDYASPEQVQGTAHTTATDVYSLGAVLYKLLTGESPRAVGAMPHVPADLACVVGKALRKEPEERYTTVESLSEDLRAFLERRPVRARAGDTWYRLRKFVRRQWVPVAATLAVMVSLSTGLYIANRQRITAQRRFQQLRQLSGKVFDLDKAIRNLPGSTEARQRLVSASLEYLEGLRADSRGDLDLAEELADAYWRVARVQGVPVELNLGQFDNAEKSLEKADALTATILNARKADRGSLLRAANIAADRMILAQEEHRRDAAIQLAKQAEQRATAFLNAGPASESDRSSMVVVYSNTAQAYRNMHLHEDSVRNARRAVEIARSVPSDKQRLCGSLSVLALAFREQGELEPALSAILEARSIAEQVKYSSETERMIGLYAILTRQGAILASGDGVSLDRPADAIEPLQKALDLTENASRLSPGDFTSRSRMATAARDLGSVLSDRDPQRAIEVYDKGIQRIGEVATNLSARRSHAILLANSSYPLRALHRVPESRQRIAQAVEELKATGDYPASHLTLDSPACVAMRAQADHAADERDFAGAIRIYQQILDGVAPGGDESRTDLWNAQNLSGIYQSLATLYRKAGEEQQAREVESRRAELWHDWDRRLPNNPFVLRQIAAR